MTFAIGAATVAELSWLRLSITVTRPRTSDRPIKMMLRIFMVCSPTDAVRAKRDVLRNNDSTSRPRWRLDCGDGCRDGG